MRAHQVTVDEVYVVGDYSNEVPGLEGTCQESGFSVEVFGQSDRSERALCAQLSQMCPGWHVVS